MSNQITKEIQEQMLEFSAGMIQITEKLRLPHSVVDQTIRSASSIGANYSEAQDASSKKDFVNKIYIAKKEAAETVYWIKLMQKIDNNTELDRYLDEAQQLVRLLQKIINSSRGKS